MPTTRSRLEPLPTVWFQLMDATEAPDDVVDAKSNPIVAAPAT